MRPVREITAAEENFRTEPVPGLAAHTVRRDPVEPEPVGTHIAMVFRITGYDRDCDGSLMARLEQVGRDGRTTGWEAKHLGLYPDTDMVLESPGELWDLAERGNAAD